ncbi:hypothetical protein [Tessaracoccus antarcticus]|uniref:PQQ-binding-like beta-propeller repeat protein n=1 Tax=Tessaracoccus antarcticus TaxID=2479848 RepID=A0A3M0G567_9ACTN|nr:hypothetical protein [Tessaracoccus antarcticus]RMB60015.1 hypothetical protein EAX62_09890 [Tessaracoccus antarcticus]
MTDPDQPFRRPQNDPAHGDAVEGPAAAAASVPATDANPIILDPDFHQSVWKPWEEPVHAAPGAGHPDAAPVTPITRPVVWAPLLLGLVIVALVVAFVVPGTRSQPSPWRLEPLVADMETGPEIAWTSAGGIECASPPQEGDHTILTDAQRVWSIDLTNGRTRWSLDLGRYGKVACLSELDLVAVTLLDTATQTVQRTVLLSAVTGQQVHEFPGSSVVQVIALGPNLGLVDAGGMLTAVRPDQLDKPLWSRQLPGSPIEDNVIGVRNIDGESVQLHYWVEEGSVGGSKGFAVSLTLSDGTPPEWAQTSTEHTVFFRIGDVLLTFDADEGGDPSILDLRGRHLWEPGRDELGASGSRLYLSTRGSAPEGRMTHLREVDPRTGKPLNGDTYDGAFDYVVDGAAGHVAVMGGNSLIILDDHLAEQPTVQFDNFLASYAGERFLYAESNIAQPGESQQTRLSAVDPGGARILWTFDLEPVQHLERLGSHLLVVDGDGTLHGLQSTR